MTRYYDIDELQRVEKRQQITDSSLCGAATYEDVNLASKLELLWLADLRGRRGEARELVEVVWGGVTAK